MLTRLLVVQTEYMEMLVMSLTNALLSSIVRISVPYIQRNLGSK